MKLREAIKLYNELCNNENIKKYLEAQHIILEKMNNEKITYEYYKSSNKYDYYIQNPYKELVFKNNKVVFRQNYYSAIGVRNNGIPKSTKPTKYCLYFCLSLCKYSKEKIAKKIDENIEEDLAEKVGR